MSDQTNPLLTEEAVEQSIGPIEEYAEQCHGASLALVRSGLLPPGSRVARGTLRGIGGQHSWAVVGDPYDPMAFVVDLTAWSYGVRDRDGKDVPRLWITTSRGGGHTPHGAGSIMNWGCPSSGGGPEVALTPTTPLSAKAADMVKMFTRVAGGPLDRFFWSTLANHAPVSDWPASEILAAMADTPALAALVPVDRLGMLTDRNPGGLYQ